MTWLYIGLVAVAASAAFYIIERNSQPPAPRGCATASTRRHCSNICRGAADCQVRTRFEPSQLPVAPTAVAFRRSGCDCRGLAEHHAWGGEGCVRP